jgi:hypothetical protein
VEKPKRIARQPLEKAENLASMSDVPARVKPLQHVIPRLSELVVVGDDPEHAQALLDEQHQALVDEGIAMQQIHEDFTRDQREMQPTGLLLLQTGIAEQMRLDLEVEI